MKILVIDDDEHIRKVAKLALEKVGGMQFVEASDGQQGASLAAAEKPDVILLDVMMPVLDGPGTFALIRTNPDLSHVPIIFLTAKAMNAEIERLRNLGAAGVLTKPFKAMTLAEDVRAILKV